MSEIKFLGTKVMNEVHGGIKENTAFWKCLLLFSAVVKPKR
jgi:hypothetical protein